MLRSYGIPIIVNIAGDTVEEYAMLASELERHGGADAIETNISCPNVKRGGLAFGVDASSAAAVVRAVKDAVSLPVIAKLSPNVTDIVHIAAACKDAGADALSLINTLLGMAIDVDKKRPALGNVFGGLSGPAVRPVAVRMVWQVYEAVGLPVIGMGGITGGRDAVEFILAGATAVAVGTGNFVDPACSLRVVGEIRDYMIRNGFRTVSEMAGLAHGPQQA